MRLYLPCEITLYAYRSISPWACGETSCRRDLRLLALPGKATKRVGANEALELAPDTSGYSSPSDRWAARSYAGGGTRPGTWGRGGQSQPSSSKPSTLLPRSALPRDLIQSGDPGGPWEGPVFPQSCPTSQRRGARPAPRTTRGGVGC